MPMADCLPDEAREEIPLYLLIPKENGFLQNISELCSKQTPISLGAIEGKRRLKKHKFVFKKCTLNLIYTVWTD